MSVTRATEADIPLIVKLGRNMHEAMARPGEYDEESVSESVRELMDCGAAFVTERGMIGGYLMPAFWNRSHKSAAEAFWWSEDGKALDLLEAFEEWARGEGAHETYIGTQSAFRGDAVGRILRRRGYAMHETYWTKGL